MQRSWIHIAINISNANRGLQAVKKHHAGFVVLRLPFGATAVHLDEWRILGDQYIGLQARQRFELRPKLCWSDR